MSAREWLYNRLTGALIPGDRVTSELDDYRAEVRAEVLTEEAAELKAHCLAHNRFAATGFADCPCRVADELLRRVKAGGRGE